MSSGRVKTKPYPYVVVDGVLSSELLMDMRRNWPGTGYFFPEIPGNYVCNLGFAGEDGFWFDFAKRVVPDLVISYLAEFAEEIENRYPGETEFHIFNYSLMQSRGNYGGHDVHNHHYHDPTWAMTLLVYLDPQSDGHNGTTVCKALEGDEAEIAAQTLNWYGLTEESETIEYKAGRVFAFHDNPIAYHCVKPSRSIFGRRILRLHVGASKTHCERLYGVDYKEYVKRRMLPSKDPEVIEWMRNDIRMLDVQGFDDEARKAWMVSKRLSFSL